MGLSIPRAPRPAVVYPDSDGQPMAENTLQYEWIVTIKGNLDGLFRDDPDVFVAGDLLWYPVEGHPEIAAAPDTLVAFGRPKGYRGSYKQFEEGGIAPQVVFEILSPGNRAAEMVRKFRFYEQYGVEEYYIYDPDEPLLTGYRRRGDVLEPIPQMHGWVSPRLGIRFDTANGELQIFRPDGGRFLTFVEMTEEAERRQRDAHAARADADAARAETERLRAKLRALGIDPDA